MFCWTETVSNVIIFLGTYHTLVFPEICNTKTNMIQIMNFLNNNLKYFSTVSLVT